MRVINGKDQGSPGGSGVYFLPRFMFLTRINSQPLIAQIIQVRETSLE